MGLKLFSNPFLLNSFRNGARSQLVKTPIENEVLVCFRTNKIKVTATPPQKVVVDGEIIGTTPVEIVCIPDGLTLFAPLVNSLIPVRKVVELSS
jgi:diacylglycerol kinase (ATP)